jgi:hypothetical protein
MPKSLPSKKISIADIPEVENFSGKFIYNFFTPDEKINSNGNAPIEYLNANDEKFNLKFAETVEFNRTIPRYIEFTWKSVVVGNNPEYNKISIKNNFDKLYYEEDFSISDFILLNIQDTNVEDRLGFVVKKAIKNIKGIAHSSGKSIQENLKDLNQATEKVITPDFLQLGLNPRTFGLNFFDSKEKNFEESVIDTLKKAKTTISINNKIIHDIVAIGAYDEIISPFADELQDFVSTAEKIQKAAEKARDSSFIDSSEYDFEIDKIVSKKLVDPNKYDSILQTIGYIIEKEEIQSDGKIIQHPPIFIENPQTNNAIDFKIKYESVYNYKIRTVAYVELQAYEENLGIVAGLGFLLASKASPVINIKCVESVPPPPPTDFNIRWDHKNNELVLSWCFPVNPQQDIKKFQIFRRKDIFEPFQLIKMYDFDDSVIKTKDNEKPLPELVEYLKYPKLIYSDKEFTKNSKYIYSICSVDAHGFSSGYSTQWEVYFDKSKNQIVKKLISTAGAPKAYPNAFINSDTFVDTIKTEWCKKIKIYFNPEYLRVYDNDNNDLKLIKANKNDKYILKLINIDLQKDQDIIIKIDDLTKNQRLSINNKKVYPIDPEQIEKTSPTELQTDKNGKWIQGSGKNSFKLGS